MGKKERQSAVYWRISNITALRQIWKIRKNEEKENSLKFEGRDEVKIEDKGIAVAIEDETGGRGTITLPYFAQLPLLLALNGTGWWVFPYLFSSNKRKNTYDFATPCPYRHFAVYRKRPPKTCPTEWNEPPELLATITPTIQGSWLGLYSKWRTTPSLRTNGFGMKRRWVDIRYRYRERPFLARPIIAFFDVYFVSWNFHALPGKYGGIKTIIIKDF